MPAAILFSITTRGTMPRANQADVGRDQAATGELMTKGTQRARMPA